MGMKEKFMENMMNQMSFAKTCLASKTASSTAAPEGGHRNDLDDTEAPVLQSPVKQVTPAGLVDAAAERV
jgi:hypothetical protein